MKCHRVYSDLENEHPKLPLGPKLPSPKWTNCLFGVSLLSAEQMCTKTVMKTRNPGAENSVSVVTKCSATGNWLLFSVSTFSFWFVRPASVPLQRKLCSTLFCQLNDPTLCHTFCLTSSQRRLQTASVAKSICIFIFCWCWKLKTAKRADSPSRVLASVWRPTGLHPGRSTSWAPYRRPSLSR